MTKILNENLALDTPREQVALPADKLLTDKIDEQIYRTYHGNYDGKVDKSLIEHLKQNQPFLWRIASLAFAAGEQAQMERISNVKQILEDYMGEWNGIAEPYIPHDLIKIRQVIELLETK